MTQLFTIICTMYTYNIMYIIYIIVFMCNSKKEDICHRPIQACFSLAMGELNHDYN